MPMRGRYCEYRKGVQQQMHGTAQALWLMALGIAAPQGRECCVIRPPRCSRIPRAGGAATPRRLTLLCPAQTRGVFPKESGGEDAQPSGGARDGQRPTTRGPSPRQRRGNLRFISSRSLPASEENRGKAALPAKERAVIACPGAERVRF